MASRSGMSCRTAACTSARVGPAGGALLLRWASAVLLIRAPHSMTAPKIVLIPLPLRPALEPARTNLGNRDQLDHIDDGLKSRAREDQPPAIFADALQDAGHVAVRIA